MEPLVHAGYSVGETLAARFFKDVCPPHPQMVPPKAEQAVLNAWSVTTAEYTRAADAGDETARAIAVAAFMLFEQCVLGPTDTKKGKPSYAVIKQRCDDWINGKWEELELEAKRVRDDRKAHARSARNVAGTTVETDNNVRERAAVRDLKRGNIASAVQKLVRTEKHEVTEQDMERLRALMPERTCELDNDIFEFIPEEPIVLSTRSPPAARERCRGRS